MVLKKKEPWFILLISSNLSFDIKHKLESGLRMFKFCIYECSMFIA